MIEVDGVRKAFASRVVLDGVSVRFERGRVCALIGPSGGGKSTLLRCINGLERFDSGRVEVDGLVLGPSSASARPGEAERATLRAIRLKAGMVFQHYGLFAHMSALENVMEAPIHVRGVPRAEARERAAQLLARVGLSHRRDAFPRELSGGEHQRVAIARALAMDPEALLLDEPTSALDPDRKAEVTRVLADLAGAGVTMLLVTHESAVVREIADRAICLREGRVVADGAPSEVL
ncbi:MAG: amino acid ABC transporter ATP-binding protein [Labilithrix sp.]|nr:amino acid ABC transporter ATP-binding protein [Labilithrix sp.]MCW5834118.1 amino acid ABC transporter ATP-binding protein [Labilithrix sp.]